ncbi:MAG: hypothetical protein ACOCQQ_03445 [Candidatus Nanoarchaeia archaeon]
MTGSGLREVSFTKQEKKDFLITTLVSSLILFFFFTKLFWKEEVVSVVNVMFHLATTILIAAISLGTVIYTTKWMAKKLAYQATYSSWKTGLVVAFVIAFITDGYLPLLVLGAMDLHIIPQLRYGKLFPGENRKEIFKILGIGTFSLLILSLFSHMIFMVTQITFFAELMTASALLLLCILLPLTKNHGALLFMSSRKNYILMFLFAIFFFVFVLLQSFYALILALVVAAFIYFLTKKWFHKQLGV